MSSVLVYLVILPYVHFGSSLWVCSSNGLGAGGILTLILCTLNSPDLLSSQLCSWLQQRSCRSEQSSPTPSTHRALMHQLKLWCVCSGTRGGGG